VEKIVSLTLRPYQQELVDGVLTAIGRGDKQTLVISPTGSGKTCSFIRLSEHLINDASGDEVVLILSHLSLLTSQTKQKFTKFSSLPVGILQASKMPSVDDRVIVSTVQSSRDFAKIAAYYELSGKKVRYIITDESHLRWSQSYKAVYDTFPEAQLIDVTATPFLRGRLAINAYDSVAFQISLSEMIEQKYLVEPVLRQIEIESDTKEKKCAIFMRTYQQYESGNKAVFFMRDKEECRLLCDALISEGVKAAIVTDAITGSKRDAILTGFEGDEYDVLVSVNVLTAGWDSLVCQAIFMQGTDSPSVYMQRLGRALRPQDGMSVKPEHDKQDARCYVFGTLPEIQSGEFIQTHNMTLKPKKYDECANFDEQADWLELNDMTDTVEYQICQASIKVQRLANKINMDVLNQLIETKSIPSQFMLKLASGVDSFKPIQGGNAPASYQQVLTMQKLGLIPPNGITSNEARLVIQSLTGKATHHHQSDKFIIKSGKFAGSHIKDVSWPFRQAILKRYPNSDIAKQIREFYPSTRGKKST
jgi:superfamily II DNA or RNA helicase